MIRKRMVERKKSKTESIMRILFIFKFVITHYNHFKRSLQNILENKYLHKVSKQEGVNNNILREMDIFKSAKIDKIGKHLRNTTK